MLNKQLYRRFNTRFSSHLAFSLSLLGAPNFALAQSNWLVGDGLWSNGGNWDLAPALNSDVFINVPGPVTVTYDSGSLNIDQLTLTAPNRLDVTAGVLGINGSVGSTSVNSGIIDVSGTGVFNILGDTLDNTGGSVVASSGGEVFSNAARIIGGVIGSSGSGRFHFSASTGNFLEGVEVTGTLDLATSNSTVRVENGMTLNGTINVNANSIFSSNNSNLIDGTGDIVFGDTGAVNRFILDGAGTTTLGSGVTVRGENGTIGGQAFVGGVQNLVVDGRVSADVAGGLITIRESAVTNNGILDAQNGGQLNIDIGVDNTAGQINVGNASTVRFNGVEIIGGQLNGSGTGLFTVSSSSGNFLDGVAVQGNIDLASANSHLRIRNNLALEGQIDVNANSILAFDGTNDVTGNAMIVLGGTGPSNRIVLDGDGTTTLGANAVIRGENGTIGGQVNVGGTQTLVVDGRVSADVAGGTLTITDSAVQNNGLLEAQNGGTLNLGSAVTNGPGGQITAGVNSSVLQSGITITGGTINTIGNGLYTANANANNILDGVDVNGNIDLASANGILRVFNDLTLNGQVDLNSNSVFTFQGDNTLDGNATIVLGDTGSSNRLVLDGDGTTTFGSNVVVEGENGTIGGQVYLGGTQVLDLQGRISANVNGGLIAISDSAVANSGVLEALNGGQLNLNSDVDSGSSGVINVGTGSTVLQNGVTISGGQITTAGTGALRAASNGNNFLDDVAVQGTIDMASATGILRVINDLSLNGQIDLNANSLLSFQGSNNITGNGQIVLGGTGASNRLILDGTGTTTFGSDIVIRGENGTIGNQNFIAGTQILDLDGRISADVAGGTLTIADSAVQNDGVLEAQNGGQLTLSSAVTNGPSGQILAGNNSTVLQNGVRITGGVLDSNGTGVIRASVSSNNVLDNVTLNGALDLASANAHETLENGLTLNGQIDVNANSILRSNGSNLIDGTGTIVFGSTGGGNRFMLDGAGTTTIGSGVTLRGEDVTIGNQLFTAGIQVLVNNGLIDADVDTGVFNFNESAVTNNNSGTLRASNGGELRFNVAVDNQGLVEALDGSAVNFTTAATTVNNMAGDLVGGVWRADDTGNGATITLRGADITTNSADVTLKGANSLIQVVTTSIDTTLDTNNGSLRLQDGRVFNATANGGNFTNNGALEVTDSTFTANTLVSDGDINSFGNSAVTTAPGNQITGTGNISSSFGNLELTRGVDMGAGSSLTSNSGASVDLSMAAQASQVDVLNNNGSLDLGSQNIVVTKDYTNANFGTGNAFDPRANVSGSGQIIGDNASQTITGNVTNTAANTFSLDLGNVRGGTSASADFQVANNGTGADIRGAIQDGANGGNLTDARLSGSGAGASNFGPVAAGADTGNFSVTFDATSGGSLAGQSLAVVSNFDNVATQIINLSGVATTLAQGSATPNSNPVDLGNFRVGGTVPSQDFAVENTSAADPTTERLGISSVGTTGNFSATNALGGGLIAGGASQAGAVSVAVNGGTAGINSGSVGIQYATNGELIDAGFTSMNANLENINVQATGFNAAVGSTTPSPTVNLGNVRIGGALSQALNVANTAAPGAFSEDLAAVFGANSGDASNNGGSIAGLLAGAANGLAMSASLDSGSAGAKSGSVTIDYTTSGEVGGVSNGLGAAAAGSEVVSLTGNVFQTAVGQLNTAPLNFGTVQVGQVVTQALGLENIATGAAGHVEDLNVRFGATSGSSNPGLISGAGSISGLAAGASDNSSLVVTVDTSAAAVVNGQILVDYFSAGTVNGANIAGLSEIPAGSDPFGVQGVIQTGGQVVDQANPSIANPVIALGNVRIGGTSATDFVDVTNVASGNAQAALSATISGNNPVTASGSFALLNPGATNNSSLQVGLNTATAGAINGTADIAFVSDASNIGNCAPNCALSLGTQSVTVTGNVFRLATGSAAANPVDLGNFRLGSGALSADLTVTNTAAADGSSEQLGIGGVTSSNALFTAANNLGATRINAQGNSAGAVTVGLGTGLTAGVNNGSVDIQYLSDGTASGTGSAINSNSENVAVSAVGYRLANPLLNTTNVTVAARVGDALPGPVAVSVSNVSPDMFTEGLNADFGMATAGFNATGSVANLVANGTSNSDLMVSLASTAVSQNTAGTVDVNFASTGAGTTGEADMAVGSATVNLTAKVYEAAVAAVSGTTTIDFGTVRVGDTGPSTEMTRQIGNTATGALVDDLQGGFSSVAAGFSADAGALTGAGIASGGNTDLTFGIDTSAAGVFSGAANLALVSHNDDLADLGLAGETFNLTGTVNNLASPIFDLNSGSATLTGGGNLYNLVFDTVLDTDNSFLMADLSVINDVVGPADMLDGFFDISGAGVFSALGFTPIDDLVAGAAQSGLMVGFDTSTQGPGAFMASIFLDPTSVFAGLSDVNLQVIELRISGLIRQTGGNVPIPGTLLLFIGPMLFLLYGVNRRRRFA